MITCQECIKSLHPDDPKVRSGRYHMCGCDYCNKPEYYRELEKPETKVIPLKTEVIYRYAEPIKKKHKVYNKYI